MRHRPFDYEGVVSLSTLARNCRTAALIIIVGLTRLSGRLWRGMLNIAEFDLLKLAKIKVHSAVSNVVNGFTIF